MSTGALDMVNFGAKDTVPEKFRDRKLHIHNPMVTLMRTNPDENQEAARWIARKLNRTDSPFSLLIPEKGVSALDQEGMPFFDPAADAALNETLEKEIRQNDLRRVSRLPLHINSPEFAEALVNEFLKLRSV